MRRVAFGVGLFALAAMSTAQNPHYRHVLRLDLENDFTSSSPLGDSAGAVAFDGSTLFVAGYRSASGAGPVGILKVATPFGVPQKSILYSIPQQAGDGADCRLEYKAGSLYYASGLGAVSTTLSGIRRILPDGSVDMSFGGDGVLNPNDVGLGFNQRLDAMTLDPYQLQFEMVALNQGRSDVFRFDTPTGSNLGWMAFTTAPTDTSWREIAMDKPGNAWFRVNNDLQFALRVSATNFSPMYTIIDLPHADLPQSCVEVIPGTNLYIQEIAYNDRTSGSNSVMLATVGGASLGTLTGTEPILGSSPAGFTSDKLNIHYANGGAANFLFVTDCGSRPGVSVYEAFPDKQVGIDLDLDLVGTAEGTYFKIEFRNPSIPSQIQKFVNVPIDGAGRLRYVPNFTGTYLVTVVGGGYLRKTVGTMTVNVDGSYFPHITPVNGDTNVDGSVDLGDFDIVGNAFGSVPGNSNWDARADLDRSDAVDLGDIDIIAENFGQQGDF